MIKLENITFRYDETSRPALYDINLTIEEGESICFMGGNGSGKSTLARIIAGLIPPDQGRVRFSDLGQAPAIGILFQNPDNQMVAVTVEKEIAFALENMAVPFEEMHSRICETMAQFGIEHLQGCLTAELSGGEKQRVALAATMISRPEILILDEPDSYLDEAGKVGLQNMLRSLRDSNPKMTILRITQYPQVARRYQRMVVLHRGKIVADNKPESILSDREACSRVGLVSNPDNFQDMALPVAGDGSSGSNSKPIAQITMRKAGFSYPEREWLLRGLNLNLTTSEVCGVVGPSGSGKSTLGELLCGLHQLTDGDMTCFSKYGTAMEVDSYRGGITGSFQQPERQFFLSSVEEEIRFGPSNFGRELTTEQVESALQSVGLPPSEFTERDPLTLSAGEKRRLAFAAILSMTPQFIVFDEPTCGLDPEGVGRFIALVMALKQAGKGIVVISHDGSVIKALADRVIHLKGPGYANQHTGSEFFESDLWRGVVSEPAS